jgi:hypothetical protein
MKQKPIHQHDCDSCTYLGTINERDGSIYDCYCCKQNSPNDWCLIGRYGVDGNYVSSDLAMLNSNVFDQLGRWYYFAVIQMARKSLIKLPEL